MASIVDLHNIAPVIPQIMSDPQYVFMTPLPPKVDEGWQPWFQEWLKALAPLGTVAVGFMMWLIARNQHNLSKEQQELMRNQLKILEKQKDIALQQKAIAKQKLALDMNNRQYEIFSRFSNLYSEFSALVYVGSYDDMRTKKNEISKEAEMFKHAFGNHIYSISLNISIQCGNVLSKRYEYDRKIITLEEYKDTASNFDKNGYKSFIYDLSDKVNEKLKIGFNTDFIDEIKDV